MNDYKIDGFKLTIIFRFGWYHWFCFDNDGSRIRLQVAGLILLFEVMKMRSDWVSGIPISLPRLGIATGFRQVHNAFRSWLHPKWHDRYFWWYLSPSYQESDLKPKVLPRRLFYDPYE